MSTDDNTFKRVQWNGDEPLPSDDDDADGMPMRPPGADLSAEDLELLTLAARAIGAERVEVVEGENWVNLYFADQPPAFSWNPLLHGDDTFNLMVDLELDVMPSGAWVGQGKGQPAALVQNGYGIDEVEEHAGDAKAATRRAVTRAAAEIGKQRS